MTYEIIDKSIKQIQIHRITKMTLQDMVTIERNYAICLNRIPHLFWCDGLLFDFATFETTTFLQQQEITEGILHWSFLRYAPMTEFKDKIEFDSGGHILISDVTSEKPLVALTEWLAKRDD